MDMFGGLTKTSSRIAIAAALGLTLGGFAFKATPAQAADLGGDCCADLEERVAELEATTVRKGNKKVSVTISGWVVKSMNFWDDGKEESFFVGDKDADLASRFAITGSATISPGWSAGYNLTVATTGDIFGMGSNQIDEDSVAYPATSGIGLNAGIYTLYSYIYLKSDTLGTLNWGYLSPASDNPAVLADISGTVIESNAVAFEGRSFFLRPNGNNGLSTATWNDFMICQGLGAGIGADCWGNPQPAVRYDSPTWGGFRFQTSYGTNTLTEVGPTPDNNFWDVAVYYTADWNSIKVSAAGAYTWIESNVYGVGENSDLWQVGASIMHKPSGLGIYALGQWEQSEGAGTAPLGFSRTITEVETCTAASGGFCGPATVQLTTFTATFDQSFTKKAQDTDVWYIKPFWRKAWSPIGATVFYGEYGQYNDQFIAGVNLCTQGFGLGTAIGAFCGVGPNAGVGEGVFVTGSEMERWGLGVVQEIDSAAMHLWARWQHQELDVDLVGFTASYADFGQGCVNGCKIKQGFDDWDLFQVGGIIFF
jgi:hypothetical protein